MEYNQLKDLSDLKGKTIKTICQLSGDEIGVVFTDNCYCVIQAFVEYEVLGISLEQNGFISDSDLYELGIISKREFTERVNKQEQESIEYHEKREYEKYLKLKGKYEKES